jgi:hypothetical protein
MRYRRIPGRAIRATAGTTAPCRAHIPVRAARKAGEGLSYSAAAKMARPVRRTASRHGAVRAAIKASAGARPTVLVAQEVPAVADLVGRAMVGPRAAVRTAVVLTG